MIKIYKENKKLITDFLFILILVLFAFVFFKFMLKLIFPFILGWILSFIFTPIVNFFERKFHIHRTFGTLISIVLFISLFSLIIFAVVNKIIYEGTLLYNNLPIYISEIKNVMEKLTLTIQNVLDAMPISIKAYIKGSNIDLGSIITSFFNTSNTFKSSMNLVLKIPNIIVIILISLVSTFFFTKDKKQIYSYFLNIFPKKLTENFSYLKQNLWDAIIGYIKAQLILMLFTFTICTIGLLVLQSPYSLIIGVIISIIDALPFFGSGFILWPLALINFLNGKTNLAVGFVIIYLTILLMRQIMEPKILGSQIGLHPLITLFSMYIGLKTFGVFGMILGPVTAIFIKAMLNIKTNLYDNKPI